MKQATQVLGRYSSLAAMAADEHQNPLTGNWAWWV